MIWTLLMLPLLAMTLVLRNGMAQRLPRLRRSRAVKLPAPPEPFADLFERVDQVLRRLGFTEPVWGLCKYQPDDAALGPALQRIYRHRRIAVLARVMAPHQPASGASCDVTFLSLTRDKQLLASIEGEIPLWRQARSPEVMLEPAEGATLTARFERHQKVMLRRGAIWLAWPKDSRWVEWALAVSNRLDALLAEGLLAGDGWHEAAGGWLCPRMSTVFKQWLQRLADFEWLPLAESEPLPARRAAVLFGVLRSQRQWQPSLRWQLILLLIFTSLLGVAIAPVLGWIMALTLVIALLMQELLDGLALRLLCGGVCWELPSLLRGARVPGAEAHPRAPLAWLLSRGLLLVFALVGWLWLTLQPDGFPVLAEWSGAPFIQSWLLCLLLVSWVSLLPLQPLVGGRLVQRLLPVSARGRLITLLALTTLGWATLAIWQRSEWPGLVALGLLLSAIQWLREERLFRWYRQGETPERGAMGRVEAAIAAIDDFDSGYRPLWRKQDQLARLLLRVEAPAPRKSSALLLAIHLIIVIGVPVLLWLQPPAIPVHSTQGLSSSSMIVARFISANESTSTARVTRHDENSW